jgi:hypothetical protein
MELLIPSWTELLGWASVLAAALLLTGCGGVLSRGRAAPEAALVAGWGGACLLLTLWGVASTVSLAVPAAIIGVLGLAGLLLPSFAPVGASWRGMLRMGAVALPVLAVMASARPSLPDTFLNLLPNAAYLWDHATFPADDRAPSYSFLPGAPYNLQLVAFLASLLIQRLATNAMIVFNILLQLAFAVFLARIVDGREEDETVPPSWGATALGLLLATALNPGFVPRYDFSGYSEASVTVAVAFAGWFAAGAVGRLAARRPAARELTLLALTLAALVNIKQDSVALAAGVIVSAVALALLRGGAGRGRSVAALLLAALPALALYLAWRWYVLGHFAVGELKPLPLAQWQFHNIPQILASMAGVVIEKPYFFGAVAVALVLLVGRWRRVGLDAATTLAALFAGVFVLYNAALFVTYIAHFPGVMSVEAHSYFRYNTHLGLLLVLVLTLFARTSAAEHGLRLAGVPRRALTAGLLGIAVLCPIVFLAFLRFDLELPQQRAWQLAALAREPLERERRLALVLPGDNGSLAAMVEGLIRYTPPRRRDADLLILPALDGQTLDRLAAQNYRFALVSCVPQGFADLPAGQAVLLERADSGWRMAGAWGYATRSLPMRRSYVVSRAPLCL